MTSDTAKTALNCLELLKVEYGDVRVIHSLHEHLATKDGIVEATESNDSFGYGIRVIKNGRWGFAASNDLTKDGIYRTARKAVELANASGSGHVVRSKEPTVKASYKTPIKIDPFKVPLSRKLNVLLEGDRAQRREKNIKISQTYYSAWKEIKLFASTEGSWIDQETVQCGGGIEATATNDHDVQSRSFPNSFRGQFNTGGYEVFEGLGLEENGQRIAEEAEALLSADECPSGEYDIILDSNQLALQIHESAGHATEGDRALGWESSYAGTTFLTPDKLNKLQYGSKIVNIVADATVPGGLGTFGYDDNGVAAKREFLVKEGIFRNYQTSREVAAVLGQKKSNGIVRADGWQRLPMIRMTNINLEPGTNGNLLELIGETKRGILFSTNRSWSIDDRRLNFQFGTEIGWEIKNGKKIRMLKNPTYTGITPKFWNSCDAICGQKDWVIWGTPNCGKGQPSQLAKTGHGCSPARFRNVSCGVIKR